MLLTMLQRSTALLLLALLGAPAAAQLPTPSPTPMALPRAKWSMTPGVTGTPTQRRDNTGAASDTKLYVFGGRDANANTNVLNALYEFDGTTWTLKTSEGALGSPPARGGACVAWDKTKKKLIVFGGDTGGATPALLGDTWEWDPVTNAWTMLTPTTSPSPRRWAALAHEPNTGGMLLFGGETALTSPPTAPSSETWLLLAGNWIPLSPATVPPARKLHSLATRADFSDVFLCCGDDASVTPQVRHLDAWRWNGANWIKFVTPTIPHGTTANQAVYDPLRKRIVVQGGQGISVPNTAGGGQYGDLYGGSPSTWCSEFDCVTNEWILYGAAGFNTADPVIGRISRYFAGFIPSLGKIYKVSGQNPSGTGTTTATCEYQAFPVAAATNVGAGCLGLLLSSTAPNDRPWVGRNFTTTCTGLATGAFPLALIGVTSTPTPLSSLHPAGVAGCNLLSSLEVQLLLGNSSGSAVLTLAIPNDPSFVSASLYHQVLQVQASGPVLTALSGSNGLKFTFGVP